MEAVTAGLAVLTTPVGQVADWVRSGENGFICRTPAEFSARALEYVRNRSLLRAHQAHSRHIADERTFAPEPWLRFIVGPGATRSVAPRLGALAHPARAS
jgi:hypothetical protein